MTEDTDPIIGYCQSTRPSCPGGQRAVRSYKDVTLCGKCWTHRKAIVKFGIYRRKTNGPETG